MNKHRIQRGLHVLSTDSRTVGDPPGPRPDDDLIDIERIVRAAWRAAPVVALTIFLCLAVAIAYLVLADRTYVAGSKIFIGGAVTDGAVEVSPVPENLKTDSEIESQMEIVRSGAMAKRVVADLNLSEDLDFLRQRQSLTSLAKTQVKRLIGLEKRVEGPAIEDLDLEERSGLAAALLQRNLTVARIGRSYVISIEFRAELPERAYRIANAYTVAYLNDRATTQAESSSKVQSWLNQRLDALGERVDASNERVEQFRTENGLVMVGEMRMVERQLSELNVQLGLARSETSRIRSIQEQYERFEQDGFEGLVDAGQVLAAGPEETGGDNGIRALLATYASLVARRDRIAGQFGPDHPQLAAIEAEEFELKATLTREVTRASSELRADLRAAQVRQRDLVAEIAALERENATANNALARLRRLEQQSEALELLYQSLLQQSEKVDQRLTYPVAIARLISEPTLPFSHASPETMPTLVLALLAGMALSGLLVLANVLRDQRFRTESDVENVLGLPFIGYLPGRRGMRGGWIPTWQRSAARALELETLRAARAMVDSVPVSSGHEGPRVIGVFSVLDREGRSAFAHRFAESLTANGARVRVLDTAFMEEDPVEPDAASIAAAVNESWPLDYVLVDLPPIGVSRAILAALPALSCTIAVVRWGSTRRRFVADRIGAMPVHGPPIVGVVLSEVALRGLARHLEPEGRLHLKSLSRRAAGRRDKRHTGPEASPASDNLLPQRGFPPVRPKSSSLSD